MQTAPSPAEARSAPHDPPHALPGRPEDTRFLTGRGQYLDDIVLPGMLHAAMLRSPHAHALVKRIDYARALEIPGVYGIITGADVAQAIEPEKGSSYPRGGSWYFIATDRARFAGEIVAVVAAENRYIAEDALDAIEVEYEPLPPVTDPERATDPDQPVLHPEAPGGNEVFHRVWDIGEVDAAFADADVVVRERFSVHRHSSTPIEGLGAIAEYDRASDRVTLWSNLANLSRFTAAARALRLTHGDVRMIVPDIGGHFGTKAWVHQRAVLLAVLSKKVGRPVKWAEDRLEHLRASHHGTSRITDIELAAKRDGTLLGFRMRTLDDQGAYVCLNEPFGPFTIMQNGLVGCYTVQHARVESRCVVTNKCPVASMRGYGRIQYFFALERGMDVLARELQMDPAALRRKNFIPAEAYPYRTPSGSLYDSGDSTALLQKAEELLDYEQLRQDQASLREEGRLVGVGFAAAVEGGGPNLPTLAAAFGVNERTGLAVEVASARLGPDGRIHVECPTLAQGQGHEATLARIAADQLGVDPADVRVTVRFDSATMPYTPVSGTYGSRFVTSGAPAAFGATRKLRSQLAQIAASALETAPEDLEFANGRISVRGVPDRGMSVRQLAARAYAAPDSFGQGSDLPLDATFRSNWPTADYPDEQGRYNGMCTYSVLIHAAVVEVNPRTGQVKILKYVGTEDCGRILNPAIVQGQTMGGIVNGIGWALTEDLVYDEEGQLLTGTFMDYLMPRFTDIPPLALGHVECPTPFSPLGAKGMGEGGVIAAPACIANAVEDAIAHLGGRIRDSHLTPETVLRAMRSQV